jgi:hypothetical protein
MGEELADFSDLTWLHVNIREKEMVRGGRERVGGVGERGKVSGVFNFKFSLLMLGKILV